MFLASVSLESVQISQPIDTFSNVEHLLHLQVIPQSTWFQQKYFFSKLETYTSSTFSSQQALAVLHQSHLQHCQKDFPLKCCTNSLCKLYT